jgi:hypothetical protein
MKKAVVIDGQGGKLGAMIVARLKGKNMSVTAVGTNSIATAAMIKAGADYGATGENPVVVNCRDADIIIGPMGIVIADALHGEVTPQMATAIGQSKAMKVLLPINKCNTLVVGVKDMPIGEVVEEAVRMVKER